VFSTVSSSPFCFFLPLRARGARCYAWCLLKKTVGHSLNNPTNNNDDNNNNNNDDDDDNNRRQQPALAAELLVRGRA
jgi:hypothetical protein